MQIKKMLFTFDYELFLGQRSGSVDNCIIKPTNLLLSVFQKHNIQSAIFFVDTMYLLKLRAIKNEYPKAENDYNAIVEQLKDIIKKKHLIFPHIHPHWLHAVYLPEINQWELKNLSKYRFNSIDVEQQEEIFSESIKILNEIILPINNDYKIDSYRAGGWCLQPFSDFKPLFLKHKIKNDFSVLPEMFYYSTVQHYDFVGFPDKSYYSFNNNPKVMEEGPFNELTISILPFPNWVRSVDYYLKKILWKFNIGYLGDGIGVVSENLEKQAHYSKGVLKEMASIELLTYTKLFFYLKKIKSTDYFQFISHPKMLSKHNLWCFEKLVKRVKSNYKVETDFRKFINE